MSTLTNDVPLSVAVVIASFGRPQLLAQMYKLIQEQTVGPDALIFSVVSDSDVSEDYADRHGVQVIFGQKGLCAQRNRALDALGSTYDLIVFYDDDFVPSRCSLEGIKRFFASHPEVVGATGNVIGDGARGPGIPFEIARELIADHESRKFSPNCIVTSLEGLYGCNMVYRASAIETSRFDERLSLYGWQEDVDFASSLSSRGRIVKTFAFSGVHQGVKYGRTSGVRLGYSQVINPIYLVRKGTMSTSFATRLIVRNVVANHIRVFKPEPWIDRVGRVRGNWIAARDLLLGRLLPERIEVL
nr:glycosyltransferase [Novosphingobium panipatense]